MDKCSTCCFFGHRKIDDTEGLRAKLSSVIEGLIIDEGVETFLFGSKSRFDSLCHELVTEIRERHPNIKRIFVRAEYPIIDDKYKAYILESYEDTFFPQRVINAGRASYALRNREMIDKSAVCVVYYDPNYSPPRKSPCRDPLAESAPKSGTEIAYRYALKKNTRVINIAEE